MPIKNKIKFQKHLKNFWQPFKNFFKWLAEPIATIYYGLTCILDNIMFHFKRISIIKTTINKKTGLKEKQILGFKFPQNNIKVFFKNIIKNVPDDVDDIYILRQSTGEIYLLANVFNQWVKNNGSKKPYVIFTRKYHKDYFDLFSSNIDGKFVPIAPSDFPYFNKMKYHYKNKRIFVYMDQNFLYGLLDKIIADDSISYTKSIFEYLKIQNYEKEFKYPQTSIIPKDTENFYSEKPFVYICPKSYTVKTLSEEFWNNLVESLKKEGINAVINSEKITVKQMVAIAEKSIGIISARTGISECLTALHKPMFILYKSAPRFHANAEKAMNLYTLSKYPNVDKNNLYEYNADITNDENIIEQITNNLKEIIYDKK